MGPSKYWTDREVTEAVDHLKAGELVMLKGDIGYGLFGTSEAAIRKMYDLKRRHPENPCIVIGDLAVLRDIARTAHPRIGEWIERTSAWTTVAVVLPVNPDSALLRTLPPWVYDKTVTNGTVATFLNTGPYLDVVIRQAYEQGVLFVGSSANPSSQGNIYEFDELPRAFVEGVDYYVNHGGCKYANSQRLATTILNFSNWTIKRRGVNWERLEREFRALQAELAPKQGL